LAVVALTSFVAHDKVHAALQAGAAGYILKDAGADEVGDAIRAADRGEVHLAPAAAAECCAPRSMNTVATPSVETAAGRG
jgi:DNA-binding NarL/FixJ family response regulator